MKLTLTTESGKTIDSWANEYLRIEVIDGNEKDQALFFGDIMDALMQARKEETLEGLGMP